MVSLHAPQAPKRSQLQFIEARNSSIVAELEKEKQRWQAIQDVVQGGLQSDNKKAPELSQKIESLQTLLKDVPKLAVAKPAESKTKRLSLRERLGDFYTQQEAFCQSLVGKDTMTAEQTAKFWNLVAILAGLRQEYADLCRVEQVWQEPQEIPQHALSSLSRYSGVEQKHYPSFVESQREFHQQSQSEKKAISAIWNKICTCFFDGEKQFLWKMRIDGCDREIKANVGRCDSDYSLFIEKQLDQLIQNGEYYSGLLSKTLDSSQSSRQHLVLKKTDAISYGNTLLGANRSLEEQKSMLAGIYQKVSCHFSRIEAVESYSFIDPLSFLYIYKQERRTKAWVRVDQLRKSWLALLHQAEEQLRLNKQELNELQTIQQIRLSSKRLSLGREYHSAPSNYNLLPHQQPKQTIPGTSSLPNMPLMRGSVAVPSSLRPQRQKRPVIIPQKMALTKNLKQLAAARRKNMQAVEIVNQLQQGKDQALWSELQNLSKESSAEPAPLSAIIVNKNESKTFAVHLQIFLDRLNSYNSIEWSKKFFNLIDALILWQKRYVSNDRRIRGRFTKLDNFFKSADYFSIFAPALSPDGAKSMDKVISHYKAVQAGRVATIEHMQRSWQRICLLIYQKAGDALDKLEKSQSTGHAVVLKPKMAACDFAFPARFEQQLAKADPTHSQKVADFVKAVKQAILEAEQCIASERNQQDNYKHLKGTRKSLQKAFNSEILPLYRGFQDQFDAQLKNVVSGDNEIIVGKRHENPFLILSKYILERRKELRNKISSGRLEIELLMRQLEDKLAQIAIAVQNRHIMEKQAGVFATLLTEKKLLVDLAKRVENVRTLLSANDKTLGQVLEPLQPFCRYIVPKVLEQQEPVACEPPDEGVLPGLLERVKQLREKAVERCQSLAQSIEDEVFTKETGLEIAQMNAATWEGKFKECCEELRPFRDVIRATPENYIELRVALIGASRAVDRFAYVAAHDGDFQVGERLGSHRLLTPFDEGFVFEERIPLSYKCQRYQRLKTRLNEFFKKQTVEFSLNPKEQKRFWILLERVQKAYQYYLDVNQSVASFKEILAIPDEAIRPLCRLSGIPYQKFIDDYLPKYKKGVQLKQTDQKAMHEVIYEISKCLKMRGSAFIASARIDPSFIAGFDQKAMLFDNILTKKKEAEIYAILNKTESLGRKVLSFTAAVQEQRIRILGLPTSKHDKEIAQIKPIVQQNYDEIATDIEEMERAIRQVEDICIQRNQVAEQAGQPTDGTPLNPFAFLVTFLAKRYTQLYTASQHIKSYAEQLKASSSMPVLYFKIVAPALQKRHKEVTLPPLNNEWRSKQKTVANPVTKTFQQNQQALAQVRKQRKQADSLIGNLLQSMQLSEVPPHLQQLEEVIKSKPERTVAVKQPQRSGSGKLLNVSLALEHFYEKLLKLQEKDWETQFLNLLDKCKDLRVPAFCKIKKLALLVKNTQEGLDQEKYVTHFSTIIGVSQETFMANFIDPAARMQPSRASILKDAKKNWEEIALWMNKQGATWLSKNKTSKSYGELLDKLEDYDPFLGHKVCKQLKVLLDGERDSMGIQSLIFSIDLALFQIKDAETRFKETKNIENLRKFYNDLTVRTAQFRLYYNTTVSDLYGKFQTEYEPKIQKFLSSSHMEKEKKNLKNPFAFLTNLLVERRKQLLEQFPEKWKTLEKKLKELDAKIELLKRLLKL